MTPAEIRAHNFTSAGRGTYRSIDVDEFVGEIATAVEGMNQEKNEYIKRINALTERVEAYKKEENNISAALLTAQKMSASITAEAEEAANAVLTSANAEAEQLLADARAKAESMVAEAEATSKSLLESANANAEKTLSEADALATEQLTKADSSSRDKMLKADSYYNEKISAADRKANELITSAEQNAAAINEKAASEQAKHQKVIEALKVEADSFRSMLLMLYAEHIEHIKNLPELADGDVAGVTAQVADEPKSSDEGAIDIAQAVYSAGKDASDEATEISDMYFGIFGDEIEENAEIEEDDEIEDDDEDDDDDDDDDEEDEDVFFGFKVDEEESTEDDAKGFSFAEELTDGEEYADFIIEGFDSIESGNVSKNGTVYEVVDDIDDDDEEGDDGDTESFFRGIFKKK